ncbi:ABC transporter substrate-binding protein [Bauldia sp.]|uniref:ABC transporter substrate-binding protein n=1 Tax=Bauldia sp. TaxID=2575872 RepID=UPI003BA9C636
MFRTVAAASLALATTSFVSASANELVINANTSDPAPKAAFTQVVEDFRAANPDIDVEFNITDHEAYKTAIRGWLTAQAPDVVFWFAGNRMAAFADRGLLEDVSDVWADNNMYENFASTRDSLTIDGKQFGVPYGYYQWGVYYRKDIFDEVGLSVPETFDDLLNACAVLNENGITPVTIGTKFLWTAAGWFDYVNLRTNGLKFHIDLMLGDVPYTDDRVRATFDNWRKLIDADCFLENHTSYSWQEAQPFLYNGEAAMYLIGNFITPNFPDEVKDDMDFFQFPIIDASVPIAEDAPTDTIHIPTRAENKDNARKFLAFVAQQDQQQKINEAMLRLPPHKGAKAKDDKYLNKGAAMLSAAAGTAQFYDRDTTPEMAKIGMEGFQEFMVRPDNIDEILERLEKARQRIFEN